MFIVHVAAKFTTSRFVKRIWITLSQTLTIFSVNSGPPQLAANKNSD